MKIIKPSFEIWERDERRGGLAIIERAGRVCYKSELGTSPESAENFTRGIIKRHHNSVLEHGDMIFEVNNDIYEIVRHTLNAIMDAGEHVPMLNMTRIGGRCIVSGNIRAWRELFAIGEPVSLAFIGFFDPVYVTGFGFSYEDYVGKPTRDVRQIFYKDLHERNERLVHLRQTVKFTCDRGVSHEFVRHRVMSFSQESTRYCNYSQDRFGNEITVIEPCYLEKGTSAYNAWRGMCEMAEDAYFAETGIGLLPQEARAVLVNSTKTELVMTGNLRAWNHFFDLRAIQTTGPAHPQAVELAQPLMKEMVKRFPEAIGAEPLWQGFTS